MLTTLTEACTWARAALTDDARARLRLHMYDTLGVALIGGQTSEGRAVRYALRRLAGNVALAPLQAPGPAAGALAASCRLTECDDIDLRSCSTPGAVAVPAALVGAHLARAGIAELLAGAAAGYELMVRVARAVDGPHAVYRGIWPTYLGAALAAAGACGTALGLERRELGEALAIAVTLTTGVAGRIVDEPSSRWFTLAHAVQGGIGAAIGAAAGLRGDPDVLSGCAAQLGLDPVLLAAADAQPAAARAGLKPYSTSRQGLAATEALRSLIAEEELEPEAIDALTVVVPEAYRAMLDRPGVPTTKLASRGIRYQLALVAFAADELYDVERARFHDEPRVRRFVERIEVRSDERLSGMYPAIWPGAVRVTAGGRVAAREVLHPAGDVETPLDWAAIDAKLARMSGFVAHPPPLARLAAAARDPHDLAPLLDVLADCSDFWR